MKQWSFNASKDIEAMKRLKAGKDIKAMKRLTLHRFCGPAFDET